MDDVVAAGILLVRRIQGFTSTEADSPSPVGEASLTAIPPSARPRSGRIGAPTVFISWAHRHSSWTEDKAGEWESQIASLAATLRRLGIEADVDLFHLDELLDWTRYGPSSVQSADYVLIAISKAWSERWTGSNSKNEGAGAAAEADTLKGLFARDQEAWQRRVILVMLPSVSAEDVPPDLARVVRVFVDPGDPDSFEPLIRLLTGQPRYPKPALGEVPLLGSSGQGSLTSLRLHLGEIERRRRALGRQESDTSRDEYARLDLAEAATRGFIDAELVLED